MSARSVAVFFYGLFMDTSLLAAKNVYPSSTVVGHIDDHTLRIGKRATLVPDPGGRAYGLLMTVKAADVAALYAEESVADYVSETVSVVLQDGARASAACYNLPASQLAGTNATYARALAELTERLGFPGDYIEHIRSQIA